MQNVEVEITRPPILVGALVRGRGGHSAVHDGAFSIAIVMVHESPPMSALIILSFR